MNMHVREEMEEVLTERTLFCLPMHKRMVVQEALDDGAPVLNLYYGDRQVSFDEPHLFDFGRKLAETARFAAGEALGWGQGYEWAEIAPLLADLADAGILTRDIAATSDTDGWTGGSPLPAALTNRACSWADIGDITQRLAGRAIDPAHLELVVPMFRIAHASLDRDGRQVGEANVFPRALRLDIPTEWKTCPYSGTRYRADRPMNSTALKAMRAHWAEMMAALSVIRTAFLTRYPAAGTAPTLADIERLSALVLAVPTYAIVAGKVPEGTLHPALSSLIRVTDGLRMATHQMMFVPIGEDALPPAAVVSVDDILDYVERNYSFHSETGVCAGPPNMVREFVEVLVEGRATAPVTFSAEVAAALGDLDAAFGYGLHAMRAHCALFTLYPVMAAAYEAIDAALGADAPAALVERFRQRAETVRTRTLLAQDRWRMDRIGTYHALFDGNGLGLAALQPTLAALMGDLMVDPALDARIAAMLGETSGLSAAQAMALARPIARFAVNARAILGAASAAQDAVNRTLGRQSPTLPFSLADLDVHGHLLGDVPQKMPMLDREIAESFGLDLVIDATGFTLSPAEAGIRNQRVDR